MNGQNQQGFFAVFQAACRKCFGPIGDRPLSETESKQLSNAIMETTGLVIGAKSLKNYSSYLFGESGAKPENPSASTLDTLARYVLEAPYTNEPERKQNEAHHPYWLQFQATLSSPAGLKKPTPQKRTAWVVATVLVLVAAIAGVVLSSRQSRKQPIFLESFNSVGEDSLANHGWLLQGKDEAWWSKRGVDTPGLTLYTLRGDNWPDQANTLEIKNLLLKKIDADCFSAEMHLRRFMPLHNWQQAGLLLLEDTSLTSQTLRLSIGYNDERGGFPGPKEIILQGVATGDETQVKPEEIIHLPLLTFERSNDSLVKENLQYLALRIEKKGDVLRCLYSASGVSNGPLKEAFSKRLSIHPKYVGLFALKGFVDYPEVVPVQVSFFKLLPLDCDK